jgi:hypothetical protein
MQDEPKSLGGDLPISRRCHVGQHHLCKGWWTQYPDESGPCECECHKIALIELG